MLMKKEVARTKKVKDEMDSIFDARQLIVLKRKLRLIAQGEECECPVTLTDIEKRYVENNM